MEETIFEHEREFRVVVADDNTDLSGLLIPVDINHLIQEIIVHPEAEDWFLGIVQDVGKFVGCDVSIRRSELLSEPNYAWPPTDGEAK